MRSRIRFMLLVFCVAGVVDWASAQQPILRVRVEPRTVVVGEPVKVTVDVLVPTWFTKAPTYPRLEIPGAIAVLRKGPSLNLIERIDGDTWAGISRSYLVYSQEQKLYTLPPAEVEVIYAREGTQSSQPVRLKFPPRTFEARIPDEAAGLDYFIA
ncbi:MAG: hypothetical protein ACE1ZS_09335, partial [Candidatus Poribacteria bacterium]